MTQTQRPKFAPDLKYTRWADFLFPAWATPVYGQPTYDKLCECEMLPVVARYTAKSRRHEVEQVVCPVCLHLAMSEQKQYDQQVAYREFDAIHPPERDNELYRLKDVFGEQSKHRLQYWKDAGLKTVPDASRNDLKASRIVLYADLLRFLKDADTWHLWTSERILDTELRTWIETLQGAWPWQWLNGWQAADYLGYASTNSLMHNRDILEPVLGPRPNEKKRGGGKIHFYRSDVLEWFKQELMPKLVMGRTSYYRQHGESLHTHGIHIPDSYRQDLIEIGGNLSAGVRKLVEQWREEQDEQKQT